MENILKVLQEPTETMYKGLSQRAQNELSPQEVSYISFLSFCDILN